MTEEERRTQPPSFEDRLRAARAQRGLDTPRGTGAPPAGAAYGVAARAGVEIVSALAVGAGIGWALDRWLGTGPWLLILFFFIGSAAGLVNLFRLVQGFGHAPGYRRRDAASGPGPDGAESAKGTNRDGTMPPAA
ncbi:MAG: AtpZ/AtpI family protein [Alphaproteobacteria bacterium]|nr:AtpZ/AtpI family protein [Alphaproteobacteria bacterium]